MNTIPHPSSIASSIATSPKKLLLLGWMILVLLVSPEVQARRDQHSYDLNFKIVRAMLEQPESKINLAQVKVTIDNMVDPTIDNAAVMRQLDQMAAEVRTTFTPYMGSMDRFWALYTYIYQPSLLSGRQPFRYNLEDDMNPRAKLLSVYLSTHKGNCISMPLLFVSLGQKLDLPVTISSAPAHLYVKFKGNDGQWHGFEATSGSKADDDRWRALFPRLTQKTIDNGLYLQPLSKKEAAASIAESLLEYYESRKTVEADEARAKLGLLLLEHYPKDAVAMVHVYLAYDSMRMRMFVAKYPTPADIPESLRARYMQIDHDGMYWGMKVKSLGYLPSTPAMDAAYHERIRRAKAENGIQ